MLRVLTVTCGTIAFLLVAPTGTSISLPSRSFNIPCCTDSPLTSRLLVSFFLAILSISSIGFNSDLKDKYDNDKNILSKVELEDLREFGMIPEFLGRLPIVFSLEGLTEDMLVKIMKEPKNAILKQYQKLLELDEVKLEFDDDALRQIAKKAMEKDTGARALRSIIEEYMLDIMYEIPKDDNIGSVTITADYIEKKGTPLIMMRGQERLPMNNAEA